MVYTLYTQSVFAMSTYHRSHQRRAGSIRRPSSRFTGKKIWWWLGAPLDGPAPSLSSILQQECHRSCCSRQFLASSKKNKNLVRQNASDALTPTTNYVTINTRHSYSTRNKSFISHRKLQRACRSLGRKARPRRRSDLSPTRTPRSHRKLRSAEDEACPLRPRDFGTPPSATSPPITTTTTTKVDDKKKSAEWLKKITRK